MVNPYKSPATPASERAHSTSLLRPDRPEIVTALWFVGLFAAHFGLVSIPAYLLGESSLDFSPFLWLAFATGLYFRLGPVRRFTLLVGSLQSRPRRAVYWPCCCPSPWILRI